MTTTDIIVSCFAGFMTPAALVLLVLWRRSQRAIDRYVATRTDWVANEKRIAEVRWSPLFRTDNSGTKLIVCLVRVDVSQTRRSELNRLEIGEVSLIEDGWEEALGKLTLTAREQMNNLNAFIEANALKMA